MVKSQEKGRISDAMLDELLDGEDAAQLFHSGTLTQELTRKLAERILGVEMDVHLAAESEQAAGNVRNGHNSKTVLTDTGSLPLAVPRDRQGTFEPQLVEKYVRRLPGFDEKVMFLFAKGNSTRTIVTLVKELYGVEVSPELISKFTDVVLEEAAEWQQRPLQETYSFVYLDAIHVRIRQLGAGGDLGGIFSHWGR